MPLPAELEAVEITTPDGTCDAHIAMPADGHEYPGVLFLMDAFGVRPVIDDWIRRIAGEGYVVLAPNLFYRSKKSPIVENVKAETTPEKRGALFQSLMPMMHQLTQEALASDSVAYIDYLNSLDNKGRIGVTGYCMGARAAIGIAAAHPDKVAVIAGFHGGNLATDQEDSPHLLASKIGAEVYMAYADDDAGATPEMQKKLSDALAAAGTKHQYETYAGAPHGYTMSDTEAYQRDAAEKHFTSLIALFGRVLK